MKRHTFIKTALAMLAVSGLGIAAAQTAVADQDRIRGYELMGDAERNTYLERLRQAQTEQERERIRQEHRDKMALRMRALNSTQGAGTGAGPGARPEQQSPLVRRKKSSARP